MRRELLTTCLVAGAVLVPAFLVNAQNKPPADSGPVFEDVSLQSGLTVPNISTPDNRYVIESMSGGVGLFDCDNDGNLDILTINSSTVNRDREGRDPMVTLYHQEPDGTFKDISQSAGLTRRGWGMGAAVANFDNDGWLDIYVTGYGGNVLYRNLGHCKFEDVTEKAGARGGGFSTGAAWADYDRDGHVDLFVSRYVHVDINDLPEFGKDKFCRYRGLLVQCGPWSLEGESDLLYHNRGHGTFEGSPCARVFTILQAASD
jgi:enediyne biosynthesis protein E4